ncbi:formimidoylglutamate deiminase [Siculibacillus lacustris]|uniref:Formimidoylglutamate deiminase n=1 Tax=Siculibacillus lacustris TaxID=1549641 RepID=A0A4Q9VXC6_9HYPH|nr:formimidoylglutamate deiminase [Siculibacillus lacustris]TBW41043.1 formimidoylglutamate deiminase [Siculibacillus lacustris]
MDDLIFDRALLPDGWHRDVRIAVADGRIAAVTPDATPEGARRVAGVALPGVGNLHSHAFQRGFAGLTETRGAAEDHFWTWREAMYRFAGALTPETLEAIAALAQIEMLESGFTAVAEFHYVHHAADGTPYDDPAAMAVAVAAAAEATGIGLTLLPVFYAHGGFGGQPTGPGQRRFVCDLDLFARIVEGGTRAVADLSGGGRVGIAPHSLRAVTEGELAALTAAYPDGPVHIHIAEQTREVEDCLAATGARPIDRLFDVAGVDGRWCLVHATHVTPGEIARMAGSGAVVGLCPITEADLGDGIFPATDFAAAGGRFGVGSDSNVLISLPQELRLLEQSQRLRDRARNRLADGARSTGRILFDTAAAGGARALGLETGRLAIGARADVVVLDADHPALAGRHDDAALDSWIFAAASNPVRDVWVAGRQVVADGRHHARAPIEARGRAALRALAG